MIKLNPFNPAPLPPLPMHLAGPTAIARAEACRKRMVHAFQKDFLLAVASREGASMDVPNAEIRMDEATAILFPEVNDSNANEYISRS